MGKLYFLLSITILALVSPALAGDFDIINFPSDNGTVNFTMPSGNVECQYTPAHFRGTYRTEDDLAELSCDRAQPAYLRIILGEKIKPHIIENPGDQPCCGDTNPFTYGHSWKSGPFECDSRADGLLCTREDSHGFRVSKSKAEVF